MSCGHRWDAASAGPEVRTLGFGVMALRYAEWGYAVVPCERGGKKPHRMLPPEGGVHWASLEAAQIREWWSDDPYASIGIATGAASALAVIDLDVKNGHDGRVSFAQWLGSWGGYLPFTYPEARTPSGGSHLWMRTPPWAAVPERPGILPGVDVKGSGGLVIAAPSARMVMGDGHDGERTEPLPVPYEWVSGCPCTVPQAPDWLPGWLDSAPVNQQRAGGTAVPDVSELAKTGVPVGERNHTIYRLACSMYRKCGTGPVASGVVLDRIMAIWRAGDISGFTERELLVCTESARKFIERQQEQERRTLRSYQAHRPEPSPPWARGG